MKQIIVNANIPEETRVAIVEKNKLIDLYIENYVRIKNKGNIYKGIVSSIEDSLDAAFIEFGEKRQGFLPLSEIRLNFYPCRIRPTRKVKVSEMLREGQEIVIQIIKDKIGGKGAAISTYLSIPGRYVVLMHSDGSSGGISKKIHNEKDRKFAKKILSKINIPQGMAVIIRTAGINCSPKELIEEFFFLCNLWEKINYSSRVEKGSTLIYREPSAIIRAIRDHFSPNINKIIIDSNDEYLEIRSYFTKYMPDLANVLEKYEKKIPLFYNFKIEKKIEELSKRKVALLSGGYIIIDQTEALVSIDVNSGKSNKEGNHETTAYKTNAEASDEIANQLRLRDLGGIIVIDFIDMLDYKHRFNIENRLAKRMQGDKSRIKISSITENGTLELTRQRLKQSHRLISHISCKKCQGTGRIRDIKGLGVVALREIVFYLNINSSLLDILNIELPMNIANFLNNEKRKELLNFGSEFKLKINIIGNSTFSDYNIKFKEIKNK